MDDLYYWRLSVPGWVFMAVTLSMLWAANPDLIEHLWQVLSTTDSGVVAAAVGALIGIGLPPALGFILEKVVNVLVFLANWTVRGAESAARLEQKLSERYRELGLDLPAQGVGGVFQAFFYTNASGPLVDWARRRRGIMYASFSSCLAVWLALAAGAAAFHVFPRSIVVPALLVSGAFVFGGYREFAIHRDTMAAWVDTIGKDMINALVVPQGTSGAASPVAPDA